MWTISDPQGNDIFLVLSFVGATRVLSLQGDGDMEDVRLSSPFSPFGHPTLFFPSFFPLSFLSELLSSRSDSLGINTEAGSLYCGRFLDPFVLVQVMSDVVVLVSQDGSRGSCVFACCPLSPSKGVRKNPFLCSMD